MNNVLASETEYVSKVFVALNYVGETLEYCEFDSCVFKECDFSDAIFSECKFIECEFHQSNLSVAQFKATRLMDVQFNECKLIGVDWTKASWSNLSLPSPISFQKCVLNDSMFYGLYLAELILDECKAHDVDFRECDLHDGQFMSSDFSYSQFNHANLSGANFEFAENYSIDITTTNIKHAIFSRQEAVCLLDSLEIELRD